MRLTPAVGLAVALLALALIAGLLVAVTHHDLTHPAPVLTTSPGPRPLTTREGISPADRSAITATGQIPRPESTR